MTRITVLGSTGSIGTSTLDVVRQNPDRFQIQNLVAGKNLDVLCSQIVEFYPKAVIVADDQTLSLLRVRLNELFLPKSKWPELAAGAEARIASVVEPEVDFVMSAIVGVSGLEATYAAIQHKKRIGLANKEVLVASGRLVMNAVRHLNVDMIPVDSEHNGAHQCFRAGARNEVTRLLLTASGGPFREMPRDDLWSVTPEQALNHPTWKMGKRITIDSATLMNKGFEVIEACWLFDLPPSRVDVVVHPQSSIHAMVEFNDGSIIAQISATDMRMPIQYALTYPERHTGPAPRVDWTQGRKWDFFAPDLQKFRALALAYQAQESGGASTCILNAADEVAVEAFLSKQIPFPAIAQTVEETLNRQAWTEPESIHEVMEIDQEARRVAEAIVVKGKWV